jgi:hypothetical protein
MLSKSWARICARSFVGMMIVGRNDLALIMHLGLRLSSVHEMENGLLIACG